MGRLTDDMTRLVGEIHAARDERGRLIKDIKHEAAEMRREVTQLRNAFSADLAGARAAWLGRLEAERRALDEAQTVRKARGRHRPR